MNMLTPFLLFIFCFATIESSPIHDKYSNGTEFFLKGLNAIYTQHISNHGQCSVELNERDAPAKILTEGEIVKIKEKWFKVEDCLLNRAYLMACGSRLFHQTIELVCSLVGHHTEHKLLKRQSVEDPIISAIDRLYYGVCCRSACTVSELVQYCTERK